MRKLLALLLALVMVLSLAACGGTEPDPTEAPTNAPTDAPTEKPTEAPTEEPTEPVVENPYTTMSHIDPDNDPYSVPKYTETVTADGWVLVENEGGDTLGYHPDSGVKIIQVEGFAFKDLDQDGKLDGYEDWRNTAEERACDLVSQMSGELMAGLSSHGGWGSFTTEPVTEGTTYDFLVAGGRAGVTRSASNLADHTTWTNNVQAAAEGMDWGIPCMFSVDPYEVSGMIESIALGATMDTELAFQIGVETAKQYRALGISALLGPQVDLTSAIMDRATGTYSEDPALTRDIAQAYINGLQSTWAEDGTDLGWGAESVYCFTKHFAGAGAGEGGRNDHHNGGRYCVFPGGNYEAHTIAYFDGAFDLPGLTGSSGVMTQYAINVDAEGNPYGGEWGGAYNPYVNDLLHENWDGLSVTDWGIFGSSGFMANWGVEEKTVAESIVIVWEQGGDMMGGLSDMDAHLEAWGLLKDAHGEEEALEIIRKHAHDILLVFFNLELFENPYNSTELCTEIVASDVAKAYGLETQIKSIVMLKNDGTIAAADGTTKTVYVPSVFVPATEGGSSADPEPAKWEPCMDTELLGKYFTVVTDTVADPSGTDDEGNAVYTENDIVRADLTGVDFIIVSMTAPYTGSADNTNEDGTTTWSPASLQYGEYTATAARETSIGGKSETVTEYDHYGAVISETTTRENRSYVGGTVAKDENYADLEMLQYCDSVAGDIPVVVTMALGRSMVWSEVEPLADAILVSFGSERTAALVEILAGNYEPYGLLPIQQIASMEAFEVSLEDLPRDVECYVDAAGNTYDFAFGLNWSGVIDDARVQTYSAEPVTDVQAFDFDAWHDAWMAENG